VQAARIRSDSGFPGVKQKDRASASACPLASRQATRWLEKATPPMAWSFRGDRGFRTMIPESQLGMHGAKDRGGEAAV
jgi:hypothetical protein